MEIKADNSNKAKKNYHGCLVGIFIFLVIYVLSFGPVISFAAWALQRWDSNADYIESVFWVEQVIYYPLSWLAEHSETCEWLLGWYVQLWMVDIFGIKSF